MRALKKPQRVALQALARHFSATWEGSGAAEAYIMVAGTRKAVDIATLKRCGTVQSSTAKPHLRFDKVATRVVKQLQRALGDATPAGMTVMVSITAPILVPAKTAASIEATIHALLGQRSRREE